MQLLPRQRPERHNGGQHRHPRQRQHRPSKLLQQLRIVRGRVRRARTSSPRGSATRTLHGPYLGRPWRVLTSPVPQPRGASARIPGSTPAQVTAGLSSRQPPTSGLQPRRWIPEQTPLRPSSGREQHHQPVTPPAAPPYPEIGPHCASLFVNMTADNYPSEIAWKVVGPSGRDAPGGEGGSSP